MHIAFLTPEYPHPKLSRSGGLGTSIKNLVLGLFKSNIKVSVFVVGQDLNETFIDEGIRIISISKQKYFAFNWYLERKRIQRIIQEYIDSDGIDLIEAPDWTGISAFMKFNVPLIIRLNGSDAYFCYLDGRPQKKKHYFLERKALTAADAIVSVSTFTGELTKRIFKLKQTISTIHNSIDTERFQPTEEPIVKGLLLYFGTIIRKKGVLELAEVFNRVVMESSEIHLLLIGKDAKDVFEHRSTLDLFYDLISVEAKQQVTYLPEVSYAEVKKYIATSQVIVLPSFAEAFPMTWLEALAMEKPLISSNVGWANELMIDGKTGYTVNPKNHIDFASKLVELLKDDNKCVSFGKEGRKHVKAKFSTEIITLQNINFYKTIIGL